MIDLFIDWYESIYTVTTYTRKHWKHRKYSTFTRIT
nr:MAG TPA: hypothetical protein [Caudoviricetes sp.]